MIKRLILLMGLLTAPLIIGLLFTYEIIKVDWISFMEIQPAYQVQEDPLPLPARSVPVSGPAFIEGLEAPVNPVARDEVSLSQGQQLYQVNCALCHGGEGLGNGPFAAFLAVKPGNLVQGPAVTSSDGALFTTISNGIPGSMPPMRENLTIMDRWDVVNYLRTLQGQ